MIYGLDYREIPWWPTGREALVMAGYPGHDREITVNIDGYDWKEMIPDTVSEALAHELPETWKLENRGTRIEVHPTGRFAGGWSAEDVHQVVVSLRELGLKPRVSIPTVTDTI